MPNGSGFLCTVPAIVIAMTDHNASSFDPAQVVADYRQVIEYLDSAPDEPIRAKYADMAKRMRDAWKGWQGEDSLHETAFGKPE
jgi:hypothetical protein